MGGGTLKSNDSNFTGPREVEVGGGSVQMSSVSGSYRSDLDDSHASAMMSGSDPLNDMASLRYVASSQDMISLKEIALDYCLTFGNTEQQSKLQAAVSSSQHTSMDEQRMSQCQDEYAEQVQQQRSGMPQSLTARNVDAQRRIKMEYKKVRMVDQV